MENPQPTPEPNPTPGQPRDVTARFADVLPATIPLNSLVVPREAMRKAAESTYLGRLTESESKGLVNRNFTVSKWTDTVMHEIVNDDRFDYDGIGHFVRHAVELLLDYYRETNAFSPEYGNYASERLQKQAQLRREASQSKLRREFVEDIAIFDEELNTARAIGDWELIGERLAFYAELLDSTRSRAQRVLLWAILYESVATRSAVMAFARWIDSTDRQRIPDDRWNPDWPGIADRFREFYNTKKGEEMAQEADNA